MPENLTEHEINERKKFIQYWNHICLIEDIEVDDEMENDIELYITGKLTANELVDFIKEKYGS